MSTELKISVKNLAELAMPEVCPRCYWLRLHAPARLPFQIFPGIFSSIDGYTKSVVHAWFEQRQSAPPWLAPLGPLAAYRPAPHYTRFNITDPQTGIRLAGTPDEILVRPDGSHLIIDYKTSRYTGAQDALFPMYTAQLNGYAYLGEQLDLHPVTGLALVYMEPATDLQDAAHDDNQRRMGFAMGFNAAILPVELDLALIPRLLHTARTLYDQPSAPAGRPGCKDCAALDGLVGLLSL
jgi:hypothetical protein